MGKQLKDRFTTEEVIEILERYLTLEIGVQEAMALLKIKRSQFFELSKRYRADPDGFSILAQRQVPTNKISYTAEKKILEELRKEKKLIEDRTNPIRFYNYSYVKNQLEEKHNVKVSLPTIISRAKKMIATERSQHNRHMIEKS